jgi:mannose-6-phosphate isomerase-like protein (cupin superfamily)
MTKTVLKALAVAAVLTPAVGFAQGPKTATYITDEEVKTVNATPGVDRTIRVVDIGPENYAVGVIHRGASAPAGGAARGAGAGAGAAAGGGAGRGAAPAAAEPCGEQSTAPASGGTPGMIAHDQQTEGYLIISGGGTLVTGGKIVNGRKSGPESEVTKVLNGPSCSGTAVGADIVKKVVKTGDIIIIPANVPHGWTDIGDHVDYLSFRPSARVLEAGYVHPSIKK